MAVYLLGQVIVRVPEAFAPYVRETSELIAEFGGEVLDVTRATEVLEGSWPLGALTALVRFPDLESARAFWESPGNARMKELRRGSAESHVAICTSILPEGDRFS